MKKPAPPAPKPSNVGHTRETLAAEVDAAASALAEAHAKTSKAFAVAKLAETEEEAARGRLEKAQRELLVVVLGLR